MILEDKVCYPCQRNFSEIENYVLNKTAIGFWRAFYGIRSKKGVLPKIDLSKHKKSSGKYDDSSKMKDDAVFFQMRKTGLTAAITPDIFKEFSEGTRTYIKLYAITPKVLFMMGRFLCKMGIELFCTAYEKEARSAQLQKARDYARHGKLKGLWPIYHRTTGSVKDLFEVGVDEKGPYKRGYYYKHEFFGNDNGDVVFSFTMGTDNWIIWLTNPSADLKEHLPVKTELLKFSTTVAALKAKKEHR